VLRAWAAQQREALSGEVVAITGSNGKTVVKEWLYELLGAPEYIHRTHASFNSELGVPLTLSALTDQHQSALVEVGIDELGAMQRHEQLVRPTIGIFTTLGDAHGENFESDEQKFKEKFKLFEHCHSLVIGRKWLRWALELGLKIPERTLVWGQGEELDPDAIKDWPFSGDYQKENALSALGGALLLGASMEDLQRRLSLLQPLEMRMQLRGAKDGGYLLEDTYSSDLSSLRWALEELVSSAPTSRKWAVLSHLGSEEKTAEAKALAATYGLDRIWWVEKPEDVGELTASFAGLDLNKTTVLVKGRRAYKLEQFAATLQDQYHSTWAEVNLSAMRRNLQKFKAHLAPETKVMAMVKAASYGSGTLEVARWLQEALSLRARGITMPILVLNVDPQQMPLLAAAGTEVELFASHQLDTWLSAKRTEVLKVHLKINTGMNRLGFAPEKVEELLKELATEARVEVVGVFSHLAAADDASKDEFTHKQLRTFEAVAKAVKMQYPAERPMKYATLPVGYADGLSRALSGGKGAVYVAGHRCAILGRVCMDMCMVDVSGLEVHPGDEVEILGPHQSASDLAKAAGTISYEVLTGIGPRVPRLYIKD